MPLFPLKDRTITLTMEKDLPKQGQVQAQLAKYASTFQQRFIPSTGPAGAAAAVLGIKSKALVLVGPAYMGFDHDAGVAEEEGIFTSHLQGWYIKPVQISIRGESYLGTYTGVSRSDGDVQNILADFRRQLTDFTPKYGTPGTQERIQIEISNNPLGTTKFLGFIKKFNFSEVITSPYMLPYELSFVGRPQDGNAINQGRLDGDIATKMGGG